MAKKIKVHEFRKASTAEQAFQRNDSTGVLENDVFTADEVHNNPHKFEVVESSQTEKLVMLEADEAHRKQKGWVKVPGWKPTKFPTSSRPMKSIVHEQDPPPAPATGIAAALAERGFKADSTYDNSGTNRQWKRGTVTVLFSGLDWQCGNATGKGSRELRKLLDKEYPASSESQRPSPAAKLTEAQARKAVHRAHRMLGIDMPEPDEETLLLAAWTKLCGGDIEAAKLAAKKG